MPKFIFFPNLVSFLLFFSNHKKTTFFNIIFWKKI
jgi:hypothetical protein